MNIRRAEPGDAARLAAFAARTFHETFAADNEPYDMEAYMSEAFTPEQLLSEILTPEAVFLIAEADAAFAGYAKLSRGVTPDGARDASSIELARLYVDRPWFGRGVAQALMDACFALSREAGLRSMWLGVWERNWRAQAFYTKLGFAACGKKTFQLGSDPQIDLVMARDL